MKRKEKINYLQTVLMNWFKGHKRKFPWREKGMTGYHYIIAEVLLQRTKAETVSYFYPEFIKRFSNWQSINSETKNNLSNFLEPIGLYSQRADRLKKLAQEMVLRNGIIPNNRKELEEIPFFGQYITNAILLFVYDKPEPLLDVNMSRVLERYFGERSLADIRYDQYLQKLSREFVKYKKPKELNWSILDFASIVCKPKPLCYQCPAQVCCKYYNKVFSKS